MFNFYDYKRLSPPSKNLATRYFASFVQNITDSKNPYQVTKKLLYAEDGSKSALTQKYNLNKLFYKKRDGEVIGREGVVRNIEQKLQEQLHIEIDLMYSTICHPIWQLLDTPYTEANINSILLSLPPDISSKCIARTTSGNIKRKHPYGKTVHALSEQDSLDALTYLLILTYEKVHDTEYASLCTEQIAATKMFMRMAMTLPLSPITADLYYRISDWLGADESDNESFYPVPMGFYSKQAIDFDGAIQCYHYWLQLALEIGLIEDTYHHKMAFLKSIDHSLAGELNVDLKDMHDYKLGTTPYLEKILNRMSDYLS
ncbi:hypothetical protein [Pseudoalteromonas sp. PPB1]|uniref:hypothetical protein n=1 Tax=Pseudoalteromonas sp. PPB1 TaxID=2756136 RepID=UPI00189192AD|nr:hypothetical protein [Pseudoalteromonas sp. PPB1]